MAIAAFLLLLGGASAFRTDWAFQKDGQDYTLSRLAMPDEKEPLSELVVTDHVVNLKRGVSKTMSSAYIQAMRQSRAVLEENANNGSVSLMAVSGGQVFLADITVGGQKFEVVVDTGSSDPWLIGTRYTCTDPISREVLNQADCLFGAPYNPAASKTHSTISNQNFNISYADQEMLNGDMGFEKFTLGGITVPKQKFAVVDHAAWYGDGVSSGLVGFAYGTLTSAYSGGNPAMDQRGKQIPYNPLFTNMYKQKRIKPVFSLAINRGIEDGGVLALGGIPNVPHSPLFVNTPIQSVGLFMGTNTPAYEFYTIEIDGYAVSGQQNAQFNVDGTNNPRKTNLMANGTTIVDSGTSLVYVPNNVAAAVAKAFKPAGVYNAYQDTYFVDCDAKVPVFGVAIEKKIFYVNPLDMVLRVSQTDCIMGVQSNNGALSVLGGVWMKNVVSVFDVGAQQMRFSARQYSGMTKASKPAGT